MVYKPVMPASVHRLLRRIVSGLPTRSASRLARNLVTRANAEREAQRYQAASALYDEALKLAPAHPRFHIQYAHMFKEARDFRNAEHHYLEALKSLPEDADLAIQLGHFYKIAGRLDEAESAYARALNLRPGWMEAKQELAQTRAFSGAADVEADLDDGAGTIAVELLPAEIGSLAPTRREGFELWRLGATRARTRGGFRRVLRGVEAIHGAIVSTASLNEISLLLDGRVINRARLHATPLSEDQTKYVFNIWHDFTDVPRGPHNVELRVTDRRGISRTHRALVDVVDPLTEAMASLSDTVVDRPAAGEDLEAAVNQRPSMIRAASRALLPSDPRSILVLRVDQLGDLVCSLPAIRRLRSLYPQASIVGLLTTANAELARALRLFDDIVIAEFQEEIADGRKVMPLDVQQRLRKRLALFDFDLAIDLGETGTSRPLLLLSGAPFLYGFKDKEFPWLTAGFDLHTHDPGNHREMAAHPRKLSALVDGLAAITAGDMVAPIAQSHADRSSLADYGIDPAKGYAVLHTGARLAYSRWPGYPALATMLLERTDLTIVVMADEAPAGLPRSDRLILVTGKIAFDGFDALLSHAALFVGNDSGPKHLAALRGTPVISLHMARLNWNEWGQGMTGSIISRRVPCAGCGISGDAEDCGKDYACLRKITPEEVFAEALRLLS